MKIVRMWGIILVIVAIAGAAAWVWWFRLSANTAEFSVTESCVTHERLVIHDHVDLRIVINSEAQAIPANVGIDGLCLRAVHTHDDTAHLHVESPVQRTFTLAEFFQVWGKPFNSTQIFDSVVDENHRIRVTVDGQEVHTYGDTVLHDGQSIEIHYEEIPS